MAHQAGAYSGFCSMKLLGSALNLPVPIRGVKCLTQKHNTISLARLDPRTSSLTVRPLGLQKCSINTMARYRSGNLDIKSISYLNIPHSFNIRSLTAIVNQILWIKKMKEIILIKYYLLTESEVITGKSRTEALMYWQSDSEVTTLRPRSEISL